MTLARAVSVMWSGTKPNSKGAVAKRRSGIKGFVCLFVCCLFFKMGEITECVVAARNH